MYADVKKKCAKCGQQFWLTADKQQVCHDQMRSPPDRCPACRPASASGDLSTAIATLEQVRGQGLGDLLPDPASLFGDILQLMGDSAAPIEARRRTFSEWLRGLDLEAMQIEKKLRAGNAADQLLRQRLELIRRLQEVTRLRYDALEAEMAQRQKLLRARLEELELQEKIAQLEALRKERIKTRKLEETRQQARLLREINPPPPVQPVDPMTEAIDTHRSQLRAKAAGKQLLLSDCIKVVQEIYRAANLEDAEKAARIRMVAEEYKQELDVLPKEVREFVEWVESGEDEADDDDGDDDDTVVEDEDEAF